MAIKPAQEVIQVITVLISEENLEVSKNPGREFAHFSRPLHLLHILAAGLLVWGLGSQLIAGSACYAEMTEPKAYNNFYTIAFKAVEKAASRVSQ